MSNNSLIADVKARQLLDSKGRPVVEVDIITEGGHCGRAGASTGTSVGSNESYVLRDNDPNLFGGLSVYKALNNVMQEELAPIRARRKEYEERIDDVYDILREGTKVARAEAAKTLAEVKHAMKIDYFETDEF